MMLLDLICFDCLMEQVNKGVSKDVGSEPIMTPFEPVNNDGLYKVNCHKGHQSLTVIDNINFEILFDYSINAIADGYYREAVSSFTSAMERYYEFFIKVVLKASGNSFSDIDNIWKTISHQSERQLGAYVILYSQTFLEESDLLNNNKETKFRNSVIHKGYIPSKDEAVNFGNRVMEIIEGSLIKLKSKYPKEVEETFDNFGYKKLAETSIKKTEKETGNELNFACVNIMTTINVKHGREINKDDGRKGDVLTQIERVIKRRNLRKLRLVKDKPIK